jgi:metallo-beta-lactamase family protein
MNITFHGAAQTVTGSQHLIEINGHRLLLDCGLYQGRRKETYDRNLNFPFEAKSVDAVLLSHAHIDHSGNLPNLVRQGFTGPIHATHATAHLTDIMTKDSGHIQEYDVQYVNKRRARKGKPPIEPLYSVDDAIVAAKQLESQEYDQTRFYPMRSITSSWKAPTAIESTMSPSRRMRNFKPFSRRRLRAAGKLSSLHSPSAAPRRSCIICTR